MIINDLMDLIKKLFGNHYKKVTVVDSSNRTEHKVEEMTVKELKSYDINKIDEITAYGGDIYIYF